MKTVKLNLDFLNGPIWKNVYDVKTGSLITGVKVIDTDAELQQLNELIQEKYSSFYTFDEEGSGCSFDEEALKKSKDSLLALMAKLMARLDEINDGSFEVEDYISPSLTAL